MIEYNPYEVDVIEQIRELIIEDENFKKRLDGSSVYLSKIPEENMRDGTVIRITYLSLYETIFYSNESHGDGYVIQVDIWDFEKEPIGLGNLIRDILRRNNFNQIGSDFNEPDEDGSYRDGRRYEGVLSK